MFISPLYVNGIMCYQHPDIFIGDITLHSTEWGHLTENENV